MISPGRSDGMVVIDKPSGLTSQQAVSRVKRTLGVGKAGHGGTLDPMATGLLVVGLGRGTRLLGYLAGDDKRYQATIRLGRATSTDDAAGVPVGPVRDATALSAAAIGAAMRSLTGIIEQVPCAVSAIKVDGRRSYDLVRQGREVELKPRTVTVSAFDAIGRIDDPPWVDLTVTVDCSTGTYVRALARDLGRSLAVGGHLTALRRTRAGRLDIAHATGLDAVGPDDVQDLAAMAALVAPLIEVDDRLARQIGYGRSVELDLPADLAAVRFGSTLLGLYRRDPDNPGWARPKIVLTQPWPAAGADTLRDLIPDEGEK